MTKQKPDWESEFDQLFGDTLWQEHKYEDTYPGEHSQYLSCSENIKDFIRKAIADSNAELEREKIILNSDLMRAIGRMRGLGHPDLYLEKRYAAQLNPEGTDK